MLVSAWSLKAVLSTSRLPDAEVVSRKLPVNARFRLEASRFRRASKAVALKVDLSSELRVYQALSWRGVALEVANVATFAVHEAYDRGLFEHLLRFPPAGYTSPGIDQLLQADKALWQHVATSVPSLPVTDPASAIKLHCQGATVAFHVVPPR